MKLTKIFSLLAIVIALSSGCGTPQQQVATANFIAGSDFAVYELGRDPGTLAGLQNLANLLPSIPLGKVSSFDMGALTAELQPLADAATAKPTDATTFNRIGAAISAAAKANGQNPTLNDAVFIQVAQDFANGINEGIQFWKGSESKRHPQPAPAIQP